jgi:RNA recognition motif-containing protein
MNQRLYVGNLSFHTTEETIRAAFAEVGGVSEVRVITDRETGQPHGFAFVTMGTADAAKRAIDAMNGTVLDGRPLRVNEAEERQPRSASVGMRRGGQRGW